MMTALRGAAAFGLLLPALMLLAPLYLYPLARIVAISFGSQHATVAHYAELFSDPFALRVLGQTLRLATIISLLCVLVAYPIAYAMRVVPDRTRRMMLVLVVLPLWTSILVRCFSWIVILGRNGVVNSALDAVGLIDTPLKLVYNSVGVYVGMVHVMLPFMVLPLYNSLRRIDMRLVDAAGTLGSGPFAAFFWIVLPLSMPGILAGALLVFMTSMGMFVIPALLGGLRDITFVMAIEKQVSELNNWELASAMSVLLVLVTGVLTLLYERASSLDAPRGPLARTLRAIFQRGPVAVLTLCTRLLPASPRRRRPQAPGAPTSRHIFVRCASWFILAGLVAPLFVIVPLAFAGESYLHFPPASYSLRWFENYFSRADWVGPTVTSVKIGSLAAAFALLLGVPASYAVARGEFRGKAAITALLVSPMIIPVVVLAISLYSLYAKLHMIGTLWGLALAHTVLALPFVVITVTAGLRSLDASHEAAAHTLGAGPLRTFWTITLPALRPSIISAAFLAFLTSFDDIVIALFLSGTSAKTLPLRIWEGIRFEIDPTIAAVSVLLIALTAVLKFAGDWLPRRGPKAEAAQEGQLVSA